MDAPDTAQQRPYFFWDYDIRDAEIHRILRHGSTEEKAWVVTRILEYAKWDDIWRYLTVDDIRENLDRLRFRRPQDRETWAYALDRWARTPSKSPALPETDPRESCASYEAEAGEMQRVVTESEARDSFSELVTEAGHAGRDTVIERHGRPIAVILGYERCLELRRQAGERAARFAIYDEIRARNAEATPEQAQADVAEAIRAVREF